METPLMLKYIVHVCLNTFTYFYTEENYHLKPVKTKPLVVLDPSSPKNFFVNPLPVQITEAYAQKYSRESRGVKYQFLPPSPPSPKLISYLYEGLKYLGIKCAL